MPNRGTRGIKLTSESDYWVQTPVPASPSRQAIFDTLCHGKPAPVGQVKEAAINLTRYLSNNTTSKATVGVHKSFNSLVVGGHLTVDGYDTQLNPDMAAGWFELRREMLNKQPRLVQAGHIPSVNPGGFPETLLWNMFPAEQGLMLRVADCAEYVTPLREIVYTADPCPPIGLITCNANSQRLRVYVDVESGEVAKRWLIEQLGKLGGPTIGIALNTKPISWRPTDLLPTPWYQLLVSEYTDWLARRMRINDSKQLRYHLQGDTNDIQQWIAGEVLEMLVRFDEGKSAHGQMTFPAFALKKISQAVQDLQREKISRKGADIQRIVKTYAAQHGIDPSQVPDHVIADAADIPIAYAKTLRSAYLTAESIHAPVALESPVNTDSGGDETTRLELVTTHNISNAPTTLDPVADEATTSNSIDEQRLSIISRVLIDAGDDAGDPLAFYTIYATTYLGMDAEIIAQLAGIGTDELAKRVATLVTHAKARLHEADYASIDS